MSKTLLPLLNKNEVVDNGIPIIMYDIKGKEHSMMFKLNLGVQGLCSQGRVEHVLPKS